MWAKVSGIKAYTRGGKVYAYERLSGTRLKHAPRKINGYWHGDEALILELASIRNRTPEPGTTQALIAAYKSHDVSVSNRKAYTDLAERTRRDYGQDLDRLTRASINEIPIARIDPREITLNDCRQMRDGWVAQYGVTQARRIMRACSVVWSYGLEYDWVSENIWKALPLPHVSKKQSSANPPWDPKEFLLMIDTAPDIGLSRAYALAFLGIRPEQLIRVTVRQLSTTTTSSKTNKEHMIAIPDVLAELFIDCQDSIMATNQANGLPWRTYNQLRSRFNRHRDDLASEDKVRRTLTLKGLNHTLGRALSETGASSREMQAAMARSLQTVAHYSRRANNRILSASAFSGLSGWLDLSNSHKIVSKNTPLDP